MIRHLAVLLALVLVGLPLLAAPSWLIGALGVIAGALCAAGIVGFSVPLLTAGAALSMIQYTLALWLSAGPPDLLVAVTFGVTLSLLLEVVEFTARFRGVAMDARVAWTQIRYWIGTAALAAAAGIILAAGAGSIALNLPPPVYPAVAAGSALGLFFGVARAVMRAGRHPSRISTPTGQC